MVENNNNAGDVEIDGRKNMNRVFVTNDSVISDTVPPVPPLPPLPPTRATDNTSNNVDEVPFNLVPTKLSVNTPGKLDKHVLDMLLNNKREFQRLQPLIDNTKSSEQNLEQARYTIEQFHENTKSYTAKKFNQEVIENLPEEIRMKEGNAAVRETDIWDVWTKARRFYPGTNEFVKFVCQYYMLPIESSSDWINKARTKFEATVRMQVQKPPSGNKDFIQKIGRHYIDQQVKKRLNDYLDKRGLKLLKHPPNQDKSDRFESHSTLVIHPVSGSDTKVKMFYLAKKKVELPVEKSNSDILQDDGELRVVLTNYIRKGIDSRELIQLCSSIINEEEKSLKVRHVIGAETYSLIDSNHHLSIYLSLACSGKWITREQSPK